VGNEHLVIGIGDIHGHYVALEELLGALDKQYEVFEPGKSILKPNIELVFTGDFIDRGEQNRLVIDKVIELDRVNLTVDQLFGNHELLALAGLDMARQIAHLDRGDFFRAYTLWSTHGLNGGDALIREFGKDQKEAFANYISCFSRGADIGTWLRKLKPFVRKTVGPSTILFTHGGIPSDLESPDKMDEYYSGFRRHMQCDSSGVGSDAKYLQDPIVSDRSIFWDRRIPGDSHRGIPTITPAGAAKLADDLSVDYIVIGHTPHPTIKSFGDRIFDIDVGMTPRYGGNEPAAIVFKQDGVYGFYARQGEKLLAKHSK
jgi:hypothetical protein